MEKRSSEEIALAVRSKAEADCECVHQASCFVRLLETFVVKVVRSGESALAVRSKVEADCVGAALHISELLESFVIDTVGRKRIVFTDNTRTSTHARARA